jgi:hypothetical protein
MLIINSLNPSFPKLTLPIHRSMIEELGSDLTWNTESEILKATLKAI